MREVPSFHASRITHHASLVTFSQFGCIFNIHWKSKGPPMPLTLPTPQDSALLMQDTTTKTANYSTPGLDLGSGFNPGGLGTPVAAVVNVTARDGASGNETYTLTLEESADNVTFTAAGATSSVTATGAVAV